MRLIIGIFLLLISFSCQTNTADKEEINDELQTTIDSTISNNNFNGVVIVAKDTTIIYTKTIGYSDFENKEKIVLNDQFVIGSISKQITAVLILRAYENGQLKLEDKIDKYLTNIQQSWARKVSIHHLLTHTHGIVDVDLSLEFEQGTQFQYSQLGYDLLAQILESVTGKSFLDLSQELFTQYSLTNTFHPKSNDYKNLVNGYTEQNDNLVFATNSLQNYAAAGSFISNADDLIRWNYLLHSNQLLQKETLELMTTRYATRNHPIFETVEYGYGLLFKKGERNLQIGALGYAPGFVSATYYYPKSQLNLVVLENTARSLNDFQETFSLHIGLMDLLNNQTIN